ncbi:MAG: hypothetical protein Q8M22_07690 [Actinomycetota bacterium]|nr:hypothetical protein [Actinomycetota bacterium]
MKQLVICIDLEQDDIRSPAASMFSWTGAHRALQWWRTHRSALSAEASINWFVRTDVQTCAVLGDGGWPLRHLYDPLSASLADGDTVGAHPHLYRAHGDGWRNDFADVEHAWECAQVALAAHLDVFGTGCTTWRWGDRAGHAGLQARLAAAGVQFDATAEPGRVGLPPPDGGAGRVPSFVGHAAEPRRTAGGLIDWPVSTCHLSRLTPPAVGVIARRPLGSFDDITDAWIEGWCCDLGESGRAVDVELLIDGAVVATAAAEWCRDDVRAAGYGDGRHGVRFGMNDEWRDLPVSAFEMRAAGHLEPLSSPPIDRRTTRGAEVTTLPLSLDTESQHFARAVAVLLAGDASHLTIATRSEVFLHPVQAAEVERNCRTLFHHLRAGRLSEPRSLPSAAAVALR